MPLYPVSDRSLPAAVHVAAAAVVLGVAQLSSAAPIVVQTNSAGAAAYTVSSTDLLQGLLPDAGSVLGPQAGNENTSLTPLPLTNGDFGSTGGGNLDPNRVITGQQIFATSSGGGIYTILDYTLPAVAGGYDITQINTHTGWNDDGRSRQDYTVSYALVSDPTTFVPLTTVARAAGGANQATELAISDLSGVTALRFAFPAQQNGYVGYREIDVIGTPTVPEPAALSLLGMAGCAVVARRRQRTEKAWKSK